jgi:hypothetical protein
MKRLLKLVKRPFISVLKNTFISSVPCRAAVAYEGIRALADGSRVPGTALPFPPDQAYIGSGATNNAGVVVTVE